MDKPIVADNKPAEVELKKGVTYYACRCGRSKSQPFCDGSHKGTSFTPKEFTVDKDQTAYLCQCKHTGNSPFCDGTHKQFSAQDVGKEGPGPTQNAAQPVATPTEEEPTVAQIHQLAKEGLSKTGHEGPMTAMGVPRNKLPHWDDIQILTAQLATRPLMETEPVDSSVIIGPKAKKPLTLNMPLLVSDMSFGSLSEEAKIALAKGAELAGTGICSGEGGMLPEEQQNNSRYLFELGSAQFGYHEALLGKIQAFHFKGGQAAKTGIGGHLPAAKNVGKISKVRNLPEGEPAISPATFTHLKTPQDFRAFADHVREVTGGIPIGFKLSANHIEKDIEFALNASADYIIMDGRGGGTGASPALFRDHISVPTIPALARARKQLEQAGVSGDVTLIITGGLRMPADFIKALALGADAVAIANSAIQAIGCVAARICNTNNCPSGVATQNPELRARLNIETSAKQLANFLNASKVLIEVMARACGHSHVNQFNIADLTTWKHEISQLSGIHYAGSGDLYTHSELI